LARDFFHEWVKLNEASGRAKLQHHLLQRRSNFFDNATYCEEAWFCNVASCSGEMTVVTSVEA